MTKKERNVYVILESMYSAYYSKEQITREQILDMYKYKINNIECNAILDDLITKDCIMNLMSFITITPIGIDRVLEFREEILKQKALDDKFSLIQDVQLKSTQSQVVLTRWLVVGTIGLLILEAVKFLWEHHFGIAFVLKDLLK